MAQSGATTSANARMASPPSDAANRHESPSPEPGRLAAAPGGAAAPLQSDVAAAGLPAASTRPAGSGPASGRAAGRTNSCRQRRRRFSRLLAVLSILLGRPYSVTMCTLGKRRSPVQSSMLQRRHAGHDPERQ